jgi:hypothetical protein
MNHRGVESGGVVVRGYAGRQSSAEPELGLFRYESSKNVFSSIGENRILEALHRNREGAP